MPAGMLKGLTAVAGGVVLGFLLGGAIALRHLETRDIDGEPQRVVVITVHPPGLREGLVDWPDDMMPYRIVGASGANRLEAVCRASDYVLRIGLVFSVGGVILALAIAGGAHVGKSLLAGVVAGGLVILICRIAPLTQADEQGIEAWAVVFGLIAACGEAILSLRPWKPRPGFEAAV